MNIVDLETPIGQIQVGVEFKNNRIIFRTRYNPSFNELIKLSLGARFEKETKTWYCENNLRNNTILCRWLGHVDKSVISPVQVKFNRPNLYRHQQRMIQFALTVKRCLWGADPGTGKTVSAFEVMEHSGISNWMWITPKGVIPELEIQLSQWGALVYPDIYYFDQLTRGKCNVVPDSMIVDESSLIKNYDSKRSKKVRELAEKVIEKDGYVILMTGTPAPQDPTDWQNPIETISPGRIREGAKKYLQDRLGHFEVHEGEYGTFRKLFTWKDSEEKCLHCGRKKDKHTLGTHSFTPGINELKRFSEEISPVVFVCRKEECLSDLPEKIFRKRIIKPTKKALRAIELIDASTDSVVQYLNKIAQLSDGFQYVIEPSNKKGKCIVCNGSGAITDVYCEDGSIPDTVAINEGRTKETTVACSVCEGSGESYKDTRRCVRVHTPKKELLIECLEEAESRGRIVVYAAFQGSNDIIEDVFKECGWDYIRIDGTGYRNSLGVDHQEAIRIFQDRTDLRKIGVFGHPGSAAYGLNFTAAVITVFYSNTYKADHREQAINRTHRPGSQGTVIIDLMYLPTDELVLQKITDKKRIEDLTMDEIKNCFKKAMEMSNE